MNLLFSLGNMELRCQIPEEKYTTDGWIYENKCSREIRTKSKEVGVISNNVLVKTLRTHGIAMASIAIIKKSLNDEIYDIYDLL